MFPRSRLLLALAVFAVGAAAFGHWLYWALQPRSGVPDDSGDNELAFFFLLYMPSAAAGLVAIVGAALLLRTLIVGKIVGTVALGIGVIHALIFGVANIGILGECRKLPRGCGDEWQNIGLAVGGLALSAYLILALWRLEVSPKAP